MKETEEKREKEFKKEDEGSPYSILSTGLLSQMARVALLCLHVQIWGFL